MTTRDKRANQEGNVRQRPNGRWEARIAFDGRSYSFSGGSRQEAVRLMSAAIAKHQEGRRPVESKEPLDKFLENWLAIAKPTLRFNSYRMYASLTHNHLIPRLGRRPLRQLQPADLQRLYADLLEVGLSPTTVRHVHSVLRRALGQAKRWRQLNTNVAELVDPPRRAQQEMQTLSREEVQQVLATVRGDRLEAAYVLALTTGLRIGEIVALRWKDVDLEQGLLSVVATLVEGRAQATKTAQSKRRVELGEMAVASLAEHRQRQATVPLPRAFVFTADRGHALDDRRLREHWTRLRQQAGVTPVRFHDLRHTAATLLLADRVHPKLVSELLGHTSVAFTLQRYGHVIPPIHREAAAAMDRLLAR